jgi:hypothetical protein
MKKNYTFGTSFLHSLQTVIFILILFLIPVKGAGQEWAPVGAKWIYDHTYGAQIYLTVIESVGDTVILDKTSRKLVTTEIFERQNPDGTFEWDSLVVSVDYIYNSMDTVFHYNQQDDSFYALYLMNVKAGDTVLVREGIENCPSDEYSCLRFEYVVDSVSIFSYTGNDLKAIYNSPAPSSRWMFNRFTDYYNNPVVERLGSLTFFWGVNDDLVPEGMISGLRCYTDVTTYYKAGYWTKTCDYLRPLSQPYSTGRLTVEPVVYPNPFNDYIRVTGILPSEYELYDIQGKIRIRGRGNEVDTSSLYPGIYFLRIAADTPQTTAIKVLKIMP